VASPGDRNETWVRIKGKVDVSLELTISSADSGVETEIDNVLEDEICIIDAVPYGEVELVVPGRKVEVDLAVSEVALCTLELDVFQNNVEFTVSDTN
jgi:hypothetical protein